MFFYFSMPSHVLILYFLCLVFIFFGRSFFCFVVSSHWESLVLGYVDVESV